MGMSKPVSVLASMAFAVLVACATATLTAAPSVGQTATEIDVIDISRFEDGKMVEHWGVPDRLGTLLQLGLFP